MKKVKFQEAEVINSKHNYPAIFEKLIVIILATILLMFSYPLLSDSNLSGLIKILSKSFLFFTGIIFIWFFVIFLKDNWRKLSYYLSEFLLILFGIYGVLMISTIFSSNSGDLYFKIANIILIFVILAILFDFKEVFKDVLEDNIEKFQKIQLKKK